MQTGGMNDLIKHSCAQRPPLHKFKYQGEGKIDVNAEGKRVEGEIEGQ